MVFTLKDRSINSSGVSSNARPETTPALLINRVTYGKADSPINSSFRNFNHFHWSALGVNYDKVTQRK